VRKLGEGASIDELLDAYPSLKTEDIQAALIYAFRQMLYNKQESRVDLTPFYIIILPIIVCDLFFAPSW